MHIILLLCLLFFTSVQAQIPSNQKTTDQDTLENLFTNNSYQQICQQHSKQISILFNKFSSLRGDISRIYFFCEAQYSYQLIRRQRRSFEIWDIKDPVSKIECFREIKHKNQDKEANVYIINRCREL